MNFNFFAILSVLVLLTSSKKDDTPAPTPPAILSFSKLTTVGSQFAPLFDHQSVVFSNKFSYANKLTLTNLFLARVSAAVAI